MFQCSVKIFPSSHKLRWPQPLRIVKQINSQENELPIRFDIMTGVKMDVRPNVTINSLRAVSLHGANNARRFGLNHLETWGRQSLA